MSLSNRQPPESHDCLLRALIVTLLLFGHSRWFGKLKRSRFVLKLNIKKDDDLKSSQLATRAKPLMEIERTDITA